MIAVARYVLAEHFRSRSFVGPLLLLATGVVVLYSQPPNPVLSTAGTVAAFVFLDLAWSGLALLNTQGDADRHVVGVVVGGRTYAQGRLLAVGAVMIGATALAIAFPVLTGRFERAPTVSEVALCSLATIGCALAGGALAALFSMPFVRSRAVAVLGLTACIVLSVPLGISPAIATAHALDTRSTSTAVSRLLPTLLAIGCFATATVLLCVLLWRRRE